MANRDQISQRLIERQQSMKYYHDRNVHNLSPLATGQHVRIQDQCTKKWFPGTVSCKRPEPRSYEVQTEWLNPATQQVPPSPCRCTTHRNGPHR